MTKKQQMDAKIAMQQEIVNGAREAGRELTREEQAEFDSLQRGIDSLENQSDDEGGSDPTGEARGEERERQRVSGIMDLCRSFEVDAKKYILGKSSIAEVKDAILDGLKTSHAPVGARSNADIGVKTDEEDKFRSAMADALVMRGGVDIGKPIGGA
ncbi:MAG: hypothetical protein RSC76_01635, partial [Oscillospiraceae bacterium]